MPENKWRVGRKVCSNRRLEMRWMWLSRRVLSSSWRVFFSVDVSSFKILRFLFIVFFYLEGGGVLA